VVLTFGSSFAVVDLLKLQCDPMALVERSSLSEFIHSPHLLHTFMLPESILKF
jgi:hypothetical protein